MSCGLFVILDFVAIRDRRVLLLGQSGGDDLVLIVWRWYVIPCVLAPDVNIVRKKPRPERGLFCGDVVD